VLAIAVAVPLITEDAFLADQLGKFLLYGMFALSVDLVWGYGGMFTFGHAAFFGWAGYVVGMLTVREAGFLPVPFWIALPAAVAAVALLALAFLIVLGPLLFATGRRFLPALAPFELNITVARYAVATIILIVALVVAHKWLAAGRRRLTEIAPGIAVTLALWLAGGVLFGRYLAEFPAVYASYYGSLASVMIALVFLYLTSSIFVFGGELNAAILRARMQDVDNSPARS
jgi:uncharacterized BrkB/YihY/UPF0761 family membrane protein